MKAAVLRQIGKPVQVEDVSMPKIGPDEVLIRTKTCGICRTDIHIQDGLAYIPDFPHILGHEPAGVVEAIGENVSNVSVGTRVAPHLFLTCGACRNCRSGRDAQCLKVRGVIGVTAPGGFAEYFKAPARNLFALPENVSFENGGLVSCAVITATHAYRRARLELGDTVVVIGAGGIGRMLIQLLAAGGMKVVAISRSREALESSTKDGAHLALSINLPDLAEQAVEFSGGEGADCAFDCVGTSATMKTAAACLGRGGRIVVIGEEPEFPEIDTIQIAQKELEIIGSRNGSFQDAVDSVEMIAQGIVRPPIHARFPLEGLNDALELMRRGKTQGRIIIELK